MKKPILSEVNRVREIMGLEVILEQEKTEKEVTDFEELLKAFKNDSTRRKTRFCQSFGWYDERGGHVKKEQIQAMVDELKKHAKAPLEESQRLAEQAPFKLE